MGKLTTVVVLTKKPSTSISGGSSLPVGIMALIQVKPNTNPWFKAVLFALVTSYLSEPFFEWLKVYQTIHWRYSYSVPIQIAIYMSAHYISRRNKFSNFS